MYEPFPIYRLLLRLSLIKKLDFLLFWCLKSHDSKLAENPARRFRLVYFWWTLNSAVTAYTLFRVYAIFAAYLGRRVAGWGSPQSRSGKNSIKENLQNKRAIQEPSVLRTPRIEPPENSNCKPPNVSLLYLLSLQIRGIEKKSRLSGCLKDLSALELVAGFHK